MTTMCPKCGSDRASESYEGRQLEAFGSLSGMLTSTDTGAAIGSIVPVMRRFAVGASTGAYAGVSPDGALFEGYECHKYITFCLPYRCNRTLS